MKGATSRGFSLLEVLIAVAVFAILGFFLLRVTTGALHWVSIQAQRDSDATTVGRLADRWMAEADSAWAIFTPPNDVNGVSNADQHELDFFTRDGSNRSYFWAYTYDAKAQTLTRYLYSAPGATPVLGETYSGVTKFVAHTYPVTALQDSSTPLYSALYKNATLHSGAVRFYASTAPWIAGGNQITYVRIETASDIREMQLVTQTAPSGFTVVLQYTPSPAPTHGPLRSLGRIVFEPQSLTYNDPVQRLARGLNAVLGGATANAQTASCSYAQLFLDNAGTIPDANAPNANDPANRTDGKGCATSVQIFGIEANYAGDFDVVYPPIGGCFSNLITRPLKWSYRSSANVLPQSITSGCTVQVESTDQNRANGGEADVVAVVQPGCASPCYALVTVRRQATLQTYQCTLSCIPKDLKYASSTTMTAYLSNDDGNSWTSVSGTSRTSFDDGNTWSTSSGSDQCSDQLSGTALGNGWTTPPTPPPCAIPSSFSWDYQAQTFDTWSDEGAPNPPPSPNPFIHTSSNTSWSPSEPPGTKGMTF